MIAPAAFNRAFARCHKDRCIECDHPISAVTREALGRAIEAHIEYVNAVKDRATDIHFQAGRLDSLIAQ